MRKKILILVSALCFFCFADVVSATINVGDKFEMRRMSYVNTDFVTSWCSNIAASANPATAETCNAYMQIMQSSVYQIRAQGKTSAEFTGICLDPNLPGPPEYNTTERWLTYTVDRVIFDKSTTSDAVKKYDRAMYYLYEVAYLGAVNVDSICNSSFTSCVASLPADERGIIQTAARMVTYYYGFGNGAGSPYFNHSGHPGYNGYETYKHTAANLAFYNNLTAGNSVSGYLLRPGESVLGATTLSQWWALSAASNAWSANARKGTMPTNRRGLIYGNPDISGATDNMAKVSQLFVNAIKAGNNDSLYKEKRLQSSDFPLSQEKVGVITHVSGNTYERKITLQISNTSTKITPGKGSFTNIKFALDGTYTGLELKSQVSVDGHNLTSTNFANIINPKFEITIQGSKQTLLNAKELSIKYTADYLDVYDANNVAIGWEASHTGYQRMLLLRDNWTPDKAEEKVKIVFDCEELKTNVEDACKTDKNSTACKEAEQEYTSLCGCDLIEKKVEENCSVNKNSPACKDAEQEYVDAGCSSCDKVKPVYKDCKDGLITDKTYCDYIEDWYEKNCDQSGVCLVDPKLNPDSSGTVADSEYFGQNCCEDLKSWLNNNKGHSYYERYSSAYTKYCEPCLTVGIGFAPDTCDMGSSTSEIKIQEPNDLRACIIGSDLTPNKHGEISGVEKKDDAGNTRTMFKNDFCNVSCKEDYVFNLPSNLGTYNSGRYFNFVASVEGTRTCVTSDIDHDEFDKQYIAAKERIVTAWNLYSQYYNASLEKNWWLSDNYVSECTWEYVADTCDYCSHPETGEPTGSSCCTGSPGCSGPDSKECLRVYDGDWSWVEYEYNKLTDSFVKKAVQPSPGSERASASSSGCGSCSCPSNRVTFSTYASLATNAREKLDDELKILSDLISAYESCSSWTTDSNRDYTFNPEIEFSYQEDYYMGLLDTPNMQSIVDNGSGPLLEYCRTTADKNYRCPTGSSSSNSYLTKSIKRITCVGAGCSLTETADNIANNYNIKQTITKKASFKPATHFMVKHPSGLVEKGNATDASYSNLGYVFPIMLTTPAGQYKYALQFKNIGQYYDNLNVTGRIFSGPKEGKKSTMNEKRVPITELKGFEADYSCNYNVLSDVMERCINVGVGFAGGQVTFGYRPISINDVFPNAPDSNKDKQGMSESRPIGSNWTGAKAEATRKEIEDNGDNIYREPQYSYTMSSSQRAKLRAFNKEQENNSNGFLNDSLYCVDGIDCKSEFLDDNSGKHFTAVGSTDESRQRGNFVGWTGSGGPSWK